jgi:predicted DNA-binding transcriptional regulator YafY
MASNIGTANHRIQWFHKKILDSSYPNAMRLAERFGISHRQAQRDVDFLAHKLNAPLLYDAEHRGYRYSEAFSLPLVITSDNDESYATALPGQDELALFGADSGVIQLQLPYTATLEITDKMTVMNLRSFIIAEEPRHRYRCEFPSIELFLGVIVATDANIRIVSPDWLRRRVVDVISKLYEMNK